MAKTPIFTNLKERVRWEFDERMETVHRIGTDQRWEGIEANFDMQVMNLSLETTIPHSQIRYAVGYLMHTCSLSRPEAFQKLADGLRDIGKIPGGTIISGRSAFGSSILRVGGKGEFVLVQRDMAIPTNELEHNDQVYLHIPDPNGIRYELDREWENRSETYGTGDTRFHVGRRYTHYAHNITHVSSIGSRTGPPERG